MSLCVLHANRKRTANLKLPSEAWPQADYAGRPAAMLSPDTRAGRAVLDLTLCVESGVYGYRRVISYLIQVSKNNLLVPLGQPFEFSDFGSWRRLGPRRVEYWDADFQEPLAHRAPHHYKLVEIIQATAGNRVLSSRKTKKTYNCSWESDPNLRESNIRRDSDPLQEFKSQWIWWGLSRH